jgi:hypothetical protein
MKVLVGEAILRRILLMRHIKKHDRAFPWSPGACRAFFAAWAEARAIVIGNFPDEGKV